MRRTLLALAVAIAGAAPGSFWWAHFADDMSKYARGWPYVLPCGTLTAVLAGAATVAVGRLGTRRHPPLWATGFVGIAIGVFGPPTVVATCAVVCMAFGW